MSHQLITLLISVSIGAAIGIYLRVFHKERCQSYGQWTLSLSWKFYAAETVFFGLLTVPQILNGDMLYAGLTAGLAGVCAWVAYTQRLKQTTPPAGNA
ncbi:MAG: hypothetical protein C0483_13430 [Pirellula sp.]|nr:hypothetical protein [Pirellula sp.]